MGGVKTPGQNEYWEQVGVGGAKELRSRNPLRKSDPMAQGTLEKTYMQRK